MDKLKKILQHEIEIIKKFKTNAMNKKLFHLAEKFEAYISAYNEVITTFIPQAEKGE